MKTITQKLSLLALTIGLASSCNRTRNLDTTTSAAPQKAEVMIGDISANKCLNIEKLNKQLEDPKFAVPAAIMTTNLKPLTEISRAKTEFFAYSSFYYKVTQANELNIFTTAHQDDCKTIQLLSASNEVLTYNITDHSEQQITFVLTDIYNENMIDIEKKTFAKRTQPYEYTVTYISPNEFKVTEKFKSIDPLCENIEYLKFEVTKNISWAQTAGGLPQQYTVDPYFLGLVQHAMVPAATPTADATAAFIYLDDPTNPVDPTQPPITPANPADPTTNPPTDPTVVTPPVAPVEPIANQIDVISVPDIIKIMSTPVRDELKICS